jgi:hypothetical protein
MAPRGISFTDAITAKLSFVVLALLCAADSAGAGVTCSGFPARPDCTNLVDNAQERGELIVTKLAPTAPPDDWLFDLRSRGGGQSDTNTQLDPGSWWFGLNFRRPDQVLDVKEVLVTYPPLAPGSPARMILDSADRWTVQYGGEPQQHVGNSLLAGGLAIPGTRNRYPVRIAGVIHSFPRSTTMGAVTIAWAPAIELNPIPPPIGGCDPGGDAANPSDSSRGLLVGYNVWRVPDTGTNTGSAADFMDALSDGDPDSGWVGFVDLRSFDLRDGTPEATNDLDPLDGARLVNRDGEMFTGDEILLFEDGPRRCAACGGRPDASRAWWYAVQPVAEGEVDPLADLGFTWLDALRGDHRIDVNGDGTFDAVSLDTTTVAGHDSPELISPQADAGIDGLGLTAAGLPLLSAPMWFSPRPRDPERGYELAPFAPPVGVPPLVPRQR